MIARLVLIAFTGFVLMGYAPRWLATSQQAWIIWVAAAALVYGGPRLFVYVWRRVVIRLRAVRLGASR